MLVLEVLQILTETRVLLRLFLDPTEFQAKLAIFLSLLVDSSFEGILKSPYALNRVLLLSEILLKL